MMEVGNRRVSAKLSVQQHKKANKPYKACDHYNITNRFETVFTKVEIHVAQIKLSRCILKLTEIKIDYFTPLSAKLSFFKFSPT